MVDLSVMLHAKFHVNASWLGMVFRGRLSFQIYPPIFQEQNSTIQTMI